VEAATFAEHLVHHSPQSEFRLLPRRAIGDRFDSSPTGSLEIDCDEFPYLPVP
jgi:hypothetical protein